MHKSILLVVPIALAWIAAASVPPPRGPSSPAAALNSFETAVKPVISEYCLSCHNATDLKGDLDLQPFMTKSGEPALQDRKLWETVVRRVRGGEMPPEGKPRPTGEQIAAMTGWIEQQTAMLDRNAVPNPGRVTVRRLNRYEYNNTVRDLLGVRIQASEDFPVDPFGYGFDNMGDVLSFSPILAEKYLKAAERVANAAIPTGVPEPAVAVRYEAEAMGQRNKLQLQTMHDFPVDGVYTLRTAWEQGLSTNYSMTVLFRVDGKEVLKQPLVWTTLMDRGMDARNISVAQGPHKVEAEVEIPANAKGAKPFLVRIEVDGPYQQVKREETASYKRIFMKGPAPAGADQQAAYAREILTALVHRAYRRPTTEEDLAPLLDLNKMVLSRGGSFEDGIRIALEGVLVNPKFLFRTEQDPPAASGAADGVHRISDVELASRLSYFLWSSIPDDELLALAEKGTLHDPRVLEGQLRRMLADAKGHALAESFCGQWLQTMNLNTLKPDATKFPEFDVALRDAMRTETEMFFQAIVTEDRSILDFLDGRFTFVNDRLAELYGIAGVTGREFRRVELDGSQRSGVLTQAGVLTVTSYPTRTSPVIRGKWILENILNAPPPPPPANVPALDVQQVGISTSVRQQLEQHRANPACATCHAQLDPLGFALENYDAIGKYRTTEGKLPLDTTGQLPDGRTFNGAGELKTLLKADAPKFVRALTEKMLTYALGRGLESYDSAAVEIIAQRVEQNGYKFSVLIEAVVESLPFQQRMREKSEAAQNEVKGSP